MTRTIAILTSVLTSLAAAAEPLLLESSDYTLTQTHEVWTPKVLSIDDEIPKDLYLPAKEPKTLYFRFSDDRKEIEIPGFRASGTLTSGNANKRVYLFTRGLSAGGRLVIERTKNGLIATFTKFGSGLPVISSARGDFEPAVRRAEQAGADQPATAPESKSKGEEKPKPESKARPQ